MVELATKKLNKRLELIHLLESMVEKKERLLNQIRLLLLSENIKETMNQIEHILSKDNIEEEQKKLWEQIKLILSKYNISNEQKASMIYILLRDSTDKQKHMRPIVEIFSRGSK